MRWAISATVTMALLITGIVIAGIWTDDHRWIETARILVLPLMLAVLSIPAAAMYKTL